MSDVDTWWRHWFVGKDVHHHGDFDLIFDLAVATLTLIKIFSGQYLRNHKVQGGDTWWGHY